jgi:hypothetical protein
MPNAWLQRPGDNYINAQAVDERFADSGPLQAIVRRQMDYLSISKTLDWSFPVQKFISLIPGMSKLLVFAPPPSN